MCALAVDHALRYCVSTLRLWNLESQRSGIVYVCSGNRCALRHYECNTLESQCFGTVYVSSDTVYVRSGSGSCAPALCKYAPVVESGVTALRHYVCVLR
ncbi:hypothetical protein AMTR_s00034p00170180 [Amborella trichopoda]|uniref:Uncharacterized protein n=1 Tax=Amborella trichopoda TaxID=13333 RepID=W1PWH3_AMBTC|nr:hypothetical protein AMTR_s00034p00170180 [Amborella trichopoda]